MEDPNGCFKIYVIHGKGDIVVEHYSNTGQLLRTLNGKNAEGIYKKIAELGLVSMHANSSYLGFELAKATIALSLGINYEQDKELQFPDGKKERINYVEKIQFKTNDIPEKDRQILESKLGGRFFTYMRNNNK
jgi:hypothetical protein